jgi:hypothetical protein
MRDRVLFRAVRDALGAGKEAEGFRLVHFSVQDTHIHLLVEAKGSECLARGMQGLAVRVAKALNRVLGRRGRVFADRYFSRILRTPTEVRHALLYVLQNARHHGFGYEGTDDCSSGHHFDGWREAGPIKAPRVAESRGSPVTAPHTWLLEKGWRVHGLLSIEDGPTPEREPRGKRRRPHSPPRARG